MIAVVAISQNEEGSSIRERVAYVVCDGRLRSGSSAVVRRVGRNLNGLDSRIVANIGN